MRTLILALAALILSASFAWAQDVYVRGYFRSDGTYVQPHYRSAPNNTVLDNWSTKGNVNPYTGQAGTRNPYSTQSQGNYSPAPSYSPTSPLYGGSLLRNNSSITGYQ